jgi:hypothetical protein
MCRPEAKWVFSRAKAIRCVLGKPISCAKKCQSESFGSGGRNSRVTFWVENGGQGASRVEDLRQGRSQRTRVREAGQSHAFDSPKSSEGRVSRMSANARAGVRAVRREAGCGSVAEPNGSTRRRIDVNSNQAERGVDRICFPDRGESVHGRCGKNFLRFCNPAALRKPVICLSWQIPFDVYVSPVFLTLRKTNIDPLEVRVNYSILVIAAPRRTTGESR